MASHTADEMQEPKEEHRMEQTAQYDQIGSKYAAYARTATLKRAERYTFFRLVGEPLASASWIWPVEIPASVYDTRAA